MAFLIFTEYVSICCQQRDTPSVLFVHASSLLLFSNESLAQYSDALIIVEVEEKSYDQKVLDLFSDATASIHV